jgi:hypothetical protein
MLDVLQLLIMQQLQMVLMLLDEISLALKLNQVNATKQTNQNIPTSTFIQTEQ